MIEARALVRRFPNRVEPAIDGVTFTVGAGEMVALAGRNGSGKTTLLDMLSTLLAPSEGRAVVAGADVVEAPRDVRRRMGYAMTGPRGFHQRLSARANLEFFAALYPALADPRARVRELVALLEIAPFADRQIRHCSDGMLQRVVIARALLGRPAVLLLDEPMRALDSVARRGLMEALRRLMQGEGTLGAVLMATHDLDAPDVAGLRTLVLSRGRLVFDGMPDAGQVARLLEAEATA